MLTVAATGTPHQIGHQHGLAARTHIARALVFYAKIFQEKAAMDWKTVRSFALKYQPYLEKNCLEYVEEMQGVAEGAGVGYEDILAMNVRTEIAFGNFSDGCTALSWVEGERSVLAQNWDWNTE
jgi:isopenicillin-N N-acyltransferase-like protein